VHFSRAFLEETGLLWEDVLNKPVGQVLSFHDELLSAGKIPEEGKLLQGLAALNKTAKRYAYQAWPVNDWGQQFMLVSLHALDKQQHGHDFFSLAQNIQGMVFLLGITRGDQIHAELVNGATAAFLNKPLDDILGKTPAELLPHELGLGFQEFCRQVMKSRQVVTRGEFIVYRGKNMFLHCSLIPVLDKKGAVEHIIGHIPHVHSNIDTTFTQQTLSHALHRSRIALFAINPMQKNYPLVMANKYFEQITGADHPTILKSSLFSFFKEDKNKVALQQLKKAVKELKTAEIVLARKLPRETKWFELRLSPSFNFNRQLISYIGFLTDVTERKNIEDQSREILNEKEALLNEISQSQHLLANVIIQTEEQQRQRIVDEIHEKLGAMLSAARLNFETASGKNQGPMMMDGMKKLDEAINRIRQITKETVPVSLDLGLFKSLQNLIAGYHRDGVNLQFICSDEEISLARTMEITVYRIINELLKNALQHGLATEVSIQLILHPRHLQLMVEDNGKGFDTGESILHGEGLKFIEQRIHLFKGKLSLESSPGHGTLASIELPLT